MSELKKTPTHYRLLSSFRAIGPYLREPQSEQGAYLFDCLAVCVSDKKSPELREFWGWWLELTQQENQQFEARYHIGLYDKNGDWQSKALPKKALDEVNRTQKAFQQKLVETLANDFELTVSIHAQSHDFV